MYIGYEYDVMRFDMFTVLCIIIYNHSYFIRVQKLFYPCKQSLFIKKKKNTHTFIFTLFVFIHTCACSLNCSSSICLFSEEWKVNPTFYQNNYALTFTEYKVLIHSIRIQHMGEKKKNEVANLSPYNISCAQKISLTRNLNSF